jgi:hypothetical protein
VLSPLLDLLDMAPLSFGQAIEDIGEVRHTLLTELACRFSVLGRRICLHCARKSEELAH